MQSSTTWAALAVLVLISGFQPVICQSPASPTEATTTTTTETAATTAQADTSSQSDGNSNAGSTNMVGGFHDIVFDLEDPTLQASLECTVTRITEDTADLSMVPVLENVTRVESQVVAGVKYRIHGFVKWMGKCREVAEEAPVMMPAHAGPCDDNEDDGFGGDGEIIHTKEEAINYVCRARMMQAPNSQSEIVATVWYQAWQSPACQSVNYQVVSGSTPQEAHDNLMFDLSRRLSSAMNTDYTPPDHDSSTSWWSTNLPYVSVACGALALFLLVGIVVTARRVAERRRQAYRVGPLEYNKAVVPQNPYMTNPAFVTLDESTSSEDTPATKPLTHTKT